MDKCYRLIDELSPRICAVKFSRWFVLELGIPKVAQMVEKCHEKGLLTIMDCKLNDVGHTNERIAKIYFEAGFDAIIASPFVGWENGLDVIFRVARPSKGVILLAYMSHPGAKDFFEALVEWERRKVPLYVLCAQFAHEKGADGVVVGATRPEKIREIKAKFPDLPIYSPGIGPQGGSAREAIEAGADYLIVGRAIVAASDPSESLERILASLP